VGKTHDRGKGGRWFDRQNREVREMRNAETVLSIIRERGKRGLPLERIYRLLFNPDLYLRAYARLYPNNDTAGKLHPVGKYQCYMAIGQAKVGL
jgi:hypothetical protein